MENLEIYNKVRSVPDEAKKTIGAGKLKGMTDINPMWRIKVLTETFGICGIGWYPEIKRQWFEKGEDGRTAAFCNVDLRVKVDGEWSEPISGTGGAMLTNHEKGVPVTSDEAYKMAYTDAISVCCKLLGVGADVYWDKDRTKYSSVEETPQNAKATAPVTSAMLYCEACGQEIQAMQIDGKTYTPGVIADRARKKHGLCLCYTCLMDFNAERELASNAVDK